MAAGNWPACIAFTLAAEGGLVDDPADPGGLTNFGIAQAAYPGLDIRALTAVGASAIYARDYWAPVAGDALAAGVDLMVFDFGVNAGVRETGLALQDCLGFAGAQRDARIGPLTLAAVAAAEAKALVIGLFGAQMAHYRACADWNDFATGWTLRCERRREAALALAG